MLTPVFVHGLGPGPSVPLTKRRCKDQPEHERKPHEHEPTQCSADEKPRQSKHRWAKEAEDLGPHRHAWRVTPGYMRGGGTYADSDSFRRARSSMTSRMRQPPVKIAAVGINQSGAPK